MLKIKILKQTFNQHKPFFVFLLKFLLFYLVFTTMYKLFLSNYNIEKNEVDCITHHVAEQTKNSLVFFGKECEIVKHEFEPSYKIIYQSKYVARVIEGCNSISVIILFASFIFAFSSTFWKTVFYMLFGSVLIYVLNFFRIALLSVALYHFPQYEHALHSIIFPLVIYGIVFLLWILWVTKFSGYVAKVTSK